MYISVFINRVVTIYFYAQCNIIAKQINNKELKKESTVINTMYMLEAT